MIWFGCPYRWYSNIVKFLTNVVSHSYVISFKWVLTLESTGTMVFLHRTWLHFNVQSSTNTNSSSILEIGLFAIVITLSYLIQQSLQQHWSFQVPILQKRSFFIPEVLELFQSRSFSWHSWLRYQSINHLQKRSFFIPELPELFQERSQFWHTRDQSINQSITHAITTGRGSCRSCVIITSKKDHFSSPNFRLFPSHSKRRYNHVHMHEWLPHTVNKYHTRLSTPKYYTSHNNWAWKTKDPNKILVWVHIGIGYTFLRFPIQKILVLENKKDESIT